MEHKVCETPYDLHIRSMKFEPTPRALPASSTCDDANDDTNSTVSSIADDFLHQDGHSTENTAMGLSGGFLRRIASSHALQQVHASSSRMRRIVSSSNLSHMGDSGNDGKQQSRQVSESGRSALIPPSLIRMVSRSESNKSEEMVYDENKPMLTQDEDGTFGDLLSEAQHYLALSMLVYMYAKLREMSVLGYTNVDFRAIDTNSYLPWDPSQEDSDGQPKTPFANGHVPDYGSDRMDHDDSSCRSLLQSSIASASVKHPRYLLNTKTASFIIRTVLVELEQEKKKFMEDGRSIESNHEKDISILKEFRTWVEDSRSDQLDNAAEAAIIDLRRKVARARWKRAILAVRIKVRIKRRYSNDSMSVGSYEDFCRKESVGEALSARADKLKDTLWDRRGKLVRRGSINGDNFKLQHRLVQDHFGLGPAHQPQYGDKKRGFNDDAAVPPTGLSRRQSCSANDIITDEMINEALDNSLTKYFKKGSVLNYMIESGIEVAWFGDRHPNEAIYCLCICRKTKRVTIVFRGSVTAHNWSNNMKVMMSEQANPLAREDYEGCEDNFCLHTGFSLYLLKRRRDDGRRKIDEIFDKVKSIGRDLSPDGKYSVSVAGHSLGGALACVFSFFAATVEEFTRVEPVRTFTFASPRVGDKSFLNAYRHLENTGRVLHARIANCGDIVPLMPTHTFVTTEKDEVAKMYKHVGLQVRLNETSALGNYRTRQGLDITYAQDNSWWTTLQMVWKNSFFMNMNTISGYGKAHVLSSYQRRLHFARQYRQGLGLSEYYSDQRRRKLKTLEEYYEIKAKTSQQSNPLVLVEERQSLYLKAAAIFSLVAFLVFTATALIPFEAWTSGNAIELQQNSFITNADRPNASQKSHTYQASDKDVMLGIGLGDVPTLLGESLSTHQCVAKEPAKRESFGEVTKTPRIGAGAWGTGLTPAFMS